MEVRSLHELDPTRSRTIVINLNTDVVATRAILSAVRCTGGRVLLVNCGPTDTGRARFEKMQDSVEFDVIEAEPRSHGATLDWLFSDLKDDRLLLLDSDAEIRQPEYVRWMDGMLDHPAVFGAGFTWGPFYVPTEWLAPDRAILYMERPWMPCVMFKTEPVRGALESGRSFEQHYVPNDFFFSRRLSLFAASRWGPPWGRPHHLFERMPPVAQKIFGQQKLGRFRRARIPVHGVRPSMICFDTGGTIFDYLKWQKELLWAGIPIELNRDEVHHYSGVTRHALWGKSALDVPEAEVEEDVIAQLDQRYGYDWFAS